MEKLYEFENKTHLSKLFKLSKYTVIYTILILTIVKFLNN